MLYTQSVILQGESIIVLLLQLSGCQLDAYSTSLYGLVKGLYKKYTKFYL